MILSLGKGQKVLYALCTCDRSTINISDNSVDWAYIDILSVLSFGILRAGYIIDFLLVVRISCRGYIS